MGIFRRTAKNAPSEDDPAQFLQELLTQVGTVKQAIGDLELSLRSVRDDALREEEAANRAYGEAEGALCDGDESRARECLRARGRHSERAERLHEQSRFYEQKIADLRVALDSLREHVDDYRADKRVAESRLSAAVARLALEKAKTALSAADARGLEVVRDKAREAEALADLHADIDEELAQLEASVRKRDGIN